MSKLATNADAKYLKEMHIDPLAQKVKELEEHMRVLSSKIHWLENKGNDE